jgi:hypothetical protein
LLSQHLALVAVALLSLTAAPPADARNLQGETLTAAELPTLAGGREPLFRGPVNVILFWRPGQEHSVDTLKQMGNCEQAFGGRPVHLVAVVSGEYPRAEIQAAVAETGTKVPILLDVGDALYGKLEVRQHPLVLVTDAKGKIALSQPYVRLRYCDIVQAHVRFVLGEIDATQLHAALNPERSSFPSDDKRNVAKRFVNMGKLEASSGACEQAMTSFRKALEISPGDEGALAGIAGCERTLTARK